MKSLWLIWNSSVSGTDYVNGDMPKTIKNRSKSLIKSGEYASMVEVFYASSMLNMDIEILYPSSFNLFTKQELYSGVVRCTSASRSITISWTSTDQDSVKNLQTGKWRPNHFVPCLKTEVPVSVIWWTHYLLSLKMAKSASLYFV